MLCLLLICACFNLSAQETSFWYQDSVYALLKSIKKFNAVEEFGRSIDYVEIALKLSEESGDQKLILKSKKTLSEIYNRMGHTEKSIAHVECLIEDTKKTASKVDLSDLYILLALGHKDLKKYDLTEKYLKTALKLAEEADYETGQRTALVNLGIVNCYNLNLEKADAYFKRSMTYKGRETSLALPFFYARAKIELGQYRKAEELLEIAEDIAIKNNYVDELLSISLTYVYLYKKEKRPEKVIYWYEKYTDYSSKHREQINNSSKENLKLKYDLNLKEDELLIAKKEKIIQKNEANSFKTILYFISISTLGLLIVVFLMYKDRKKINKLNKILSANNIELNKAKQEIESLSNIKSNFFSIVSHEIRTPLYTIKGIADLLVKDKEGKEQKSFFESIKYASEHLISLVNNMLRTNNIEKNKKLQINEQSFSLSELAENLVTTFKYYSRKSNNKIHLKFDNNIDALLKGDAIKLSQVINNLLGNAIKFTNKGNVWLCVALKKDSGSYQKISFTVKDDGIGLDEQKQKAIMHNDFMSESIKSDGEHQGSGLGLYICKKLLDCLGGKLSLKSELNKGSEFSFSLYLNKVINEPSKTEEETVPKKKERVFKGLKIMVVDDNKINLKITKKILEQRGFQVVVFDEPNEAIKSLKTIECDLVLMDIHMPEIDGYQATRAIRDFNQKIPIVALTAASLKDSKDRALESGMNDIVSKPFVIEEFFETLTEHLFHNKSNVLNKTA